MNPTSIKFRWVTKLLQKFTQKEEYRKQKIECVWAHNFSLNFYYKTFLGQTTSGLYSFWSSWWYLNLCESMVFRVVSSLVLCLSNDFGLVSMVVGSVFCRNLNEVIMLVGSGTLLVDEFFPLCVILFYNYVGCSFDLHWFGLDSFSPS